MAAFVEYARYDAVGLAQLIADREVSESEVLGAFRARLEAVNPQVNAVVTILEHEAGAGDGAGTSASSPLRGVPFLLKDLAAQVKGAATTFGSRLLARAVATHDSEIVARYRRAGLVLAGKTNTPEMGLAITTEPALFGPTRNPWDLTRSAGGSSGGSAAAVAAGIVPCAYATDGGGSIRIPASCCGLFGMKPTRARTSLAPDAGERNAGFFTQHAITRSVRDSAVLLDISAGTVAGDPYCAPPLERPLAQEVGAPVGKLRIALQREAGPQAPVSRECREAVEDAARLCEDLGHSVTEVAPCYDLEALIDAARVMWSANLAFALKGLHDGRAPIADSIEPFTAYFAEIGRGRSAEEYLRALQSLRTQGCALARLLETHDVLLTPTLAAEPVALGTFDTSSARSVEDARELFVRQFRYSPFTMIANASGNPAMSVPLAWSPATGLPLGSQFVGRFGDEATLFRLAAQLEQARPWFERRPRAGTPPR